MNAFSAFFFIVSDLIVLLKSHSHIVCSIYVNQFYSNTGDLLAKFQVILKSPSPKEAFKIGSLVQEIFKSRQHIFTGFLGKGARDSFWTNTNLLHPRNTSYTIVVMIKSLTKLLKMRASCNNSHPACVCRMLDILKLILLDSFKAWNRFVYKDWF